MNIRKRILTTWTFVGGLLAVALTGCATPRLAAPDTLHVRVNLRPMTNILVEDRVTMAFTDIARDVFHREGLHQPVEEARFASINELEDFPYLLTINLHEWRVDHLGNVECTFTASLQTPMGKRDLGVYTGTELRGFGGGFGRWGIARSFEDAAEGALKDLVRDVARSELLPQLRSSGAARAA